MLISIFHFYEQKKYYVLFIIVYILAIIGFLTKGLITLLCLIISLLVFFNYNKDLKKLWSRYHCIGLALFVAVIAGYYGLYARYNSLAGFFPALTSDTLSKLQPNTYCSAILYQLPLIVFWHMLPFSALVIFLLRKVLRINIQICFS